jgi:hypothetical protein
MYSLLLVITLLANQPQGASARFLETVPVFGTNSKADCERLIPYAVSYWTRMYAEKGQYVSVIPSCIKAS